MFVLLVCKLFFYVLWRQKKQKHKKNTEKINKFPHSYSVFSFCHSCSGCVEIFAWQGNTLHESFENFKRYMRPTACCQSCQQHVFRMLFVAGKKKQQKPTFYYKSFVILFCFVFFFLCDCSDDGKILFKCFNN